MRDPSLLDAFVNLILNHVEFALKTSSYSIFVQFQFAHYLLLQTLSITRYLSVNHIVVIVTL